MIGNGENKIEVLPGMFMRSTPKPGQECHGERLLIGIRFVIVVLHDHRADDCKIFIRRCWVPVMTHRETLIPIYFN